MELEKLTNPMHNVAVSIVLPTFNVEKYIAGALESCMSQTLKNIEIIVVDDGGTDRSIAIAEELSNRDSRIKVLKQDKNLGTYAARARGVLKAKGNYVLFLDPDDTLAINAAEVLYTTAASSQTDIVFYGVRTLPLANFNPARSVRGLPSKKVRGRSILEDIFTNSPKMLHGTPGKMYSTSLARKVVGMIGFPSEKLVYGEDILFLFTAGALGDKYTVCPIPLYNYYLHDSAITASASSEKIRFCVSQADMVRDQLVKVSSELKLISQDGTTLDKALASTLSRLEYNKNILLARISGDGFSKKDQHRHLKKAVSLYPTPQNVIKYFIYVISGRIIGL